MNARAALDAIHEYLKTKNIVDEVSEFTDGDSVDRSLDLIAQKFADALKG